jgi:hypothetical protein
MRIHVRTLAIIALTSGALALAACDVTNPGPIPDEELNVPEAVPGLVTGMSSDLSVALGPLQEISGIVGDDMAHGGSYTAEGLWWRGIIRAEDINGNWARMHRARWVAEQGIERMKNEIQGYTYGKDTYSARANLYAGFANRMLGEHMCQAVFDGGPAEDFKNHFSRAEAYFSEALTVATAINNTSLKQAAYAGRAQVRAALGRWTEAAADAAQVPTTFSFIASFSTNSTRENNSFVSETWVRREYTVYLTKWAQVFGDPRVQWDTVKTSSGAIQKGQDGKTNYFRQRKFIDLGSDVALAKGQEMRLIEAEALLRAGDIPGAWVKVNLARASYGMSPSAIPGNATQAWPVFQFERAATIWNETRRFYDLRRFQNEPPPLKISYLDGRDSCFPVSQEEKDANPNID